MSRQSAADAKDAEPEEATPKAKRGGSTARVNIISAGENGDGEVLEFAPGEKVPAWLVERIQAEGRAEKLLV